MDENDLINGLRLPRRDPRTPQDAALAATMTHQAETPEMGFDRRLVDYATNRAMAPVNAIMGLRDLTNRAMQGEQVSADPSAGFQALRGMSWLGGLAPRPPAGAVLPAVLGPRKFAASPNLIKHDLLNKETGQPVGYISMSPHPDPKNPGQQLLWTNMVQGQSGPWQEGWKGTKELLGSIHENYPWATGWGGFRISGARGAAGAPMKQTYRFEAPHFDKEEMASELARVQRERLASEQYWARANENQQRFADNPNLPGVEPPFSQDASARRAAFEASHALAARTPERLPQSQQGTRLTPESERNWARLTEEMHQQEAEPAAPRQRRSREEIRRMAGLPTDPMQQQPWLGNELEESLARIIRALGIQE